MSNIYYTANLYNNVPDIAKAEFQVTLDQPLLDDMSKYQMTIQKFSLPTQLLPILVYRDDYYKIGVTWNGQRFLKQVPFIPTINIPTTSPDFLYLYSYVNLTKMINVAIYEIFQDLKTAGFSPSTDYAPFIVYDQSQGQFYINFPRTDWERNSTSSTNPILYFNENLNALFGNFETFCYISGSTESPDTNDIWFALITSFTGYNSNVGYVPGYLGYASQPASPGLSFIVNFQEFSNLSSTLEPISILLTTSKIPIRAQNFNSPSQNPGSYSSLPICTDFMYQIQNPSDIRTRINFLQLGKPTRWIDILGRGQLKTISFEFYWTNKRGEIFPLYIGEFESIEVVFIFKRIED
jgi:hypothetical protein